MHLVPVLLYMTLEENFACACIRCDKPDIAGSFGVQTLRITPQAHHAIGETEIIAERVKLLDLPRLHEGVKPH
jgi:hypothetical protein